MKNALMLVSIVALFACGCETYRAVEVRTPRIDVETPAGSGITPTLAVKVFREVADQLGFVISGPHQVARSTILCSASADAGNPLSRISLSLVMDQKVATFNTEIFGTKKDLDVARNTAALFERALDGLGVKYEIHDRAAPPFLGP